MVSIHPYKGSATAILQNFKKLRTNSRATLITPETVRKDFHGIFKTANFGEAEEILWDPHAGWAEAADVLTDVIKTAISNGVRYIEGVVSKLWLDEGVCHGAIVDDEWVVPAERTLLCIGADTARILADSAPESPELDVGDRFVAAAITVAKVKLSDHQADRYRDAPAGLWDTSPAHGKHQLPS